MQKNPAIIERVQAGEFVSTATRTLLAAGYEVTNCERHPGYAEISCEIISRLGARVRYLIAFTDQQDFSQAQREEISRDAEADQRSVALVARYAGEQQASWEEFLDALGGAIPSWRALNEEYADLLQITAQNELPEGKTGEAWRLFEELVADGLEFVLGRRVRRLGGNKRGLAVSDMLAQLPDGGLEVVDAKASNEPFVADWSAMRPLVEYVEKQKQRQRGQNDVIGALLVSSSFKQGETALSDLARRFLAETGVPLAFLPSHTLVGMVHRMQVGPHLRGAIRWRLLFAGGLVELATLEREAEQAGNEQYAREN